MKKVVIVVIGILMIIPVVTKRIINNRNYELDTATEVYTKAEVDSKLAEIRKSIESNTTAITETKNLLTTIQNSLKNYALKTALIEANSNIDNLLTIANNNTKRIDALTKSSVGELKFEICSKSNRSYAFTSSKMNISDYDIVKTGSTLNSASLEVYPSDLFNDPTITLTAPNHDVGYLLFCFKKDNTVFRITNSRQTISKGSSFSFKISDYEDNITDSTNDHLCRGIGIYQYAVDSSTNNTVTLSISIKA